MIKIVSISFDNKTKIIMCIAVVIAFCTIIYNFYNICLRKENTNIESILDIKAFEAESEIIINSNKNSNVYVVKEEANLDNNSFKFIIDDMEINIDKEQIHILNYNFKSEFLSSNYIEKYNYMSIASIIQLYNDVKNGKIAGKITELKIDNSIEYKIFVENEKMQNIEIYVSENELYEIKIFNREMKLVYDIKVKSLMPKKI